MYEPADARFRMRVNNILVPEVLKDIADIKIIDEIIYNYNATIHSNY